MVRNYLITTIRNLRRRPGYSILNLLGLTLGIAAALFILLFITNELSYDRYHERRDRIFRISSDVKEPDNAFKWAITQFPLGPTVGREFAAVEAYVRFSPNGRTRFEYRDDNFFDEDVYLVDSTVFDVFSFELISGDPATVLDRPNTIVLSETLARRIFGEESPVGKFLKSDAEQPYEVTGIYRDMSRQSHLRASAMIAGSSLQNAQQADNWGGFGIYTYVLLKPDADPAAFERDLSQVIDKYVATIFNQFNIKIKYVVIPLADIHLRSDFQAEASPSGNRAFVYIFAAVAFFLLLIAGINYMNLATARSTQRSLEVGMRKVLGSGRGQLIVQFLTESLLLTLLALTAGFAIVALLLPVINTLLGLELDRGLLLSCPVLLGALIIVLLLGILSGSYPAFYLSGFQPIGVLKGKLARGSGNPRLRQGLVVVQFAVTVFMIIGTGVIIDQMNYVRQKDLGFDRDQVLTFQMNSPEAQSQWTVIRERLLGQPNFSAAGTAGTTPGQGGGRLVCSVESAAGKMEQLGVALYPVDYEFFPTLGVSFAEGRNFSAEQGTDSSQAVLVNQAMVQRMKWDNPIGKQIRFGGGDNAPLRRVIGVVKDFHQEALYNPIEPMAYVPGANNSIAHVRIKGEVEPAIAYLGQLWQENFPQQPFEYEFVDENLRELYEADQIRFRIFTLFSVLMILIACLGLIGLASFTAEQRTKEIGIRRIVGARSADIIVLLTRNYVLLVALATVPAFLGAWYFMSRWLDTFTYHTSLKLWLFPAAFVLTAVIALMATLYQALRAAGGNPVKALRYE